MAFRKKNINEIFGTVLVLSALLSTASAVDCFGKSFHCVNSTHFMICVDLGGGVSQSIDDFLIPCPPPTVCQGTNHFECEYPAVTTPSTTLSNVISDTTEPWEEIIVTTNSPPKNTSTTKEYSEKYMNTVSITTVAEDNLTTDTTVDVTTEAFSPIDVNSNSNVPEIISISPSYEVTTRFDGITNTVSDNIVTGTAEVITAMPQIIPIHQIQNVTNETIGDNVTLTLSNTEPTVTLNNNYIFVQNDSVRNITSTSPSNIFTSRNVSGDIVTENPSMIDTTTTTERPLTLITDESFVTGINLLVTTAQTLVSTDELQNVANINIQTTTPEPALIQHTLDKEQFQITGFEENFTTKSVKNSEKEQSNILTPDHVPDRLPITTYQSTVTAVTNMDVKNEVIVETTIASEQPTTTTYKVNLSTHHIDHDIYTTESPLTISTDRKLDTQNFSNSDQVPTKLIDDAIVYRSNEQSTTNINILLTNIDVTTKQTVDITTETQKQPVTDQLKINKDIPVTEQVQKLIDTGIESQKLSEKRLATDSDIITEKSSDLATETQDKQINEQIIITKNTTTTGSDAEAGVSVLLNEAKKLMDKGVQQSKDNTQSLTTENYALTENPSVFTTEIQNILVTEPPEINKNNSAIEQVQKLNDSIIESPKSNGKRLATDPDIITDKLSDLATATQQKQGNEQIIITKNTTTTGSDAAAGVSVLLIEAKKLIDKGVQQSKDNTQSLTTENYAFTENPSVFTTELQKLLVTEPPKINKNNSAIEQVQKLNDSIIESPKSNGKKLNTDPGIITEKLSDLATATQQKQGNEQIIINKNITTADNNVAAEVSGLPKGAQKSIEKGIQQSKFSTQSLVTDNGTITKNPSEFATETPKQVIVTTLTGNDALTEASVLPLEAQTLTYNVVEQRKINTNSSPTEVVSAFTTVTQQSVHLSTDLLTTVRSDLLSEFDITTKKAGVESWTMDGGHEPTKQITEEEKPIFIGTENTTTNKNYLSFDNYAIVNKTSDFTTEAQKPIYISTEQPITRTQSIATDTIAENSVLSIEVQKPTYMSTPTTKATDINVNFEKANVSTIATPNSVSTSTEPPITIMNDQATDIKLTTDILIDTATGPSKPKIQIQEEVTLGLSDYDVEIEKQKQEGSTTDTTSFTVITTGVAAQSLDVTEQPIITALVDSIVPDTTISNIDKFHYNTSSNAKVTGTTVVQSINTTTATTTEPTTIKLAEDKMKGVTTAFSSIVKASDSDIVNESTVDNVQIINHSTDEQPNQNTPEVTADTVGSLIPITVQTVNIKKDNETATAKPTPNLSNGLQIDTNMDKTDMPNGLTINTSFNIINEVKHLSPNAVQPTQDPQSVGEIVDKNQHTTKNNFLVTETAFTTEQTKIHNNIDASDVAISNNVINEDTSKTVKVSSELHTTERVNLIPAENIAGQLLMTETYATTDPTLNLNPVINSIDLNLQKVIKNQSKSTNSVYSDQLTGAAEATSETTATENFTPSLDSNSKSSQKNKHLTPNNQVTTEITNTVVDNLAEEASSFITATASSSISKENGIIYNTLTTLNTQDNSYVSFTTEELASLHGNVANNQIPKLTTVSENEAHESSSIYYPNNEIDYFTSPRVEEKTDTAFTQQSTTVSGIDYESHVSTKNEMEQYVEITTQIFSTRQPMQTIESNKNENTKNLLFNPLSNILLDKINKAVSPVTESSTSFRIKNDGNINSMGILSFGTHSEIDNGSTQLPQMQNANGVTTQPSIPIVRTNDNLPSSSLNSLLVAGDLHKVKYPVSIAKTENVSIIPTEKSLRETLITKEVPKTESTTELSLKEGVKNVYKIIEGYFNTPSETSTPGSFNEKGNAAIDPIISIHDFSTKTSSSMYNTESSLYGTKDNYDSSFSKLGPVPTVNNLKPRVTYSGYSTKITEIEMTTELSKKKVEGNIALNKPVISAAVPVPDYNREISTANINKPIPIASHGTKTSETKTLQEPSNSATYYPRKYVTSAMNNYQYVTEKSDTNTSSKSNGITENIFPEATVSSQQSINSFKKVAKSLSGQINEKKLVNTSKSQYNSSFYSDTANFGSKLTIATESTDFKSSNNLSNAADKQSPSKSRSNYTIATSQVTEKVVLATNTNKDVNSAAKENKFQNNSSFGHYAIPVISSKNVSQDINKIGPSLSRNATNTTKFNTPKSTPKTTTHSTEHNPAQVEPMSTTQNKIHSEITTSQAPIKKITPRPVVSITTTENPSKQIPKTALANFSCINGIRGRYSDKDDCRKFYICFGNSQPIVGNCPANTVFSDISKLCTKNPSHCIRENEFKCSSAGRFSDVTKDNVYYICVSYKSHLYRFKFQCQIGFTLNKTTIKCEENRKIESNQPVSISLSQNRNDEIIINSSSSISSSISSSSSDSSSTSTSSDSSSSSSSNDSSSGDSNSNSSSSKDNSSGNSDSSSSKRKKKKENKEKPEDKEGDEEDEVFECEKEGKFPVRNDCKRYYLCKKNGKSEYRRKIKKCESGEVFHKGKKNNKNSSKSSDSDSDDDRRPLNRRRRKEKKGKHEGKEDEDDDQEVCKCGVFPVSGDCKQEKKESKEKPEGKEGDEEDEVFECEKEGKFPIRNDCKRYYLCKKHRKSYRRKIKKCESDEVFHKTKKKCVDADSYEC